MPASWKGTCTYELLPDAPALAALHRQLARRGAAPTLAALNPAAGAVLRSLLYADPVARFIVERLAALASLGPLTMRTLVTLSAEYDKTMATTIFFNPELVAEIVDDQGRLVWSRIAPRHFRSTTFLQYKSVLKHAGFLTPTRLGGTSAHSYDPDQDQWQWAL